MLFLSRYSVIRFCIILMQYHSYLLFSVHEAARVEFSVEMVPLCKNIIMRPFGNMRPFGKLQQQFRKGIQHYRLQDDNYDAQFGYIFLLIGNDLYNEPLSEAYRKYLPEQYYTKRSKLWCMKAHSQDK